MSVLNPHWDFIPEAIVAGTKFDDNDQDVHISGKLAKAIRAEAKETGKKDFEVVYDYLLAYLGDSSLPKQIPANCLPIQIQVTGQLASLLRQNADARDITPEDSAIEILSEVFNVAHPKFRKLGKRKSIPKGLAFSITVPGVVAQAIRRSNYPNPISSDLIVSILQGFFPDPEQPPMFGPDDCV